MNEPLHPAAPAQGQPLLPSDPKRPYVVGVVSMSVLACLFNAWVAQDPITRTSCWLTAVVLVGILFKLMRGMPLMRAVRWALAMGWCHLFVTTWTDGGIFSLKNHWLLVLMISGYYVLDARKDRWWLLLAATTVLAQTCLGLFWPPPWPRSTGLLVTIMALWDLLLPTLAIFLVLQFFRRQYDEDLDATGKRQHQLQAKQRELEQTLQGREHFIASVSHELRTPMNVILGLNAVLLERVQDKPQARKVLEYTRQSADHLMTVINDVLDHSQWRTGQITSHVERFALRDTLRSAFEMFQPRVEGSALRYVCEIAEDVPDWVETDRHRLMQVLVNLLGNAIKFTHQGQVCLQVSTNAEGVVFKVQDSGIGIPVDQQQQIFERFRQADPGIQSRYGGSGLGLAISQRLVQMLGGQLHLQSRPGKGSVFWFCLPLTGLPAPKAHRPTPPTWPTSRVSVRRFLVVDDHPVNRLLVQQVLQRYWPQAQVLQAQNGLVALQLLEQGGGVDLVVMDMVMPVMDGIEATRRLRQNAAWQKLPVLGLTANVNPQDLENFKSAGLSAVMLKPFEPAQLRAQVEQLLPQCADQAHTH